jgi:hypothetical protein
MRRMGLMFIAAAVLPLFSFGPIWALEAKNHEIGRECRACHQEIVAAFPVEIHGRAACGNGCIECKACHGEPNLHMETGDTANIINPAKVNEKAASRICLKCHIGAWTAHSRDDLKHCPSCHRVHSVMPGKTPFNTAGR